MTCTLETAAADEEYQSEYNSQIKGFFSVLSLASHNGVMEVVA